MCIRDSLQILFNFQKKQVTSDLVGAALCTNFVALQSKRGILFGHKSLVIVVTFLKTMGIVFKGPSSLLFSLNPITIMWPIQL